MELQELLAEGDPERWRQLAEDIARYHEVEVVGSPETCLVMMQIKDSVGQTPFYAGEVLMTEATVRVNGILAHGFTLEDDPVRALCHAVITAAMQSEMPEKTLIEEVLKEETERLHCRRIEEDGLIASSRVRFDIMEGT
ncbi:MAG: phosphonate C-P lyase system protein PhnG [Negativicutes bacterium]